MVKAAEKSAVLSSELKSRRQAPWISHGPVGSPFACAGVKSLIMPRKCSRLRPCAAALIPSASTRTHAPTDQKKVLLCIVASRDFGNILPCRAFTSGRRGACHPLPRSTSYNENRRQKLQCPKKKLVGGE